MRDMFINILLLSNFCFIGCTNYETDTTTKLNYYIEYLTKNSISESTNHNELRINSNLKRKVCETSKVNGNKKKKTSDTNQNRKLQSLKVATKKSTPDRNMCSDRFDPPTIVFSDNKRYDMWHRATNVFNTICKKYFKFTQIRDINFDECDYFKSLTTVESADLFYSIFTPLLNLEKGFFPESINKPNLNEFGYLYNYLTKVKDISYNLGHAFKILSGFCKYYDLKDLTQQLLYKIYINMYKLDEIKSTVLTIFYYYPTDAHELKDLSRIHNLKFFIAKAIVLIDLANKQLDTISEVKKEEIIERINKLLKKNLYNYFNGFSQTSRHMTKHSDIQEKFINYKNANITFKQDDFIFLYHLIGKKKDVFLNYISHNSNLQVSTVEYENFYLILIRALNRLDLLGKFIVENTYKINEDYKLIEISNNLLELLK